MGLQSAMTTALTGLQAAETSIDVVGNNVANSNTVGFKESNAVFATQFLQTQSIGSAPSGTRGGTNPRQIGLGVKVAAITPDFTQGTIEISANPLDVAVQGDGFLIVQGSQGETLYTRNGQLQTNASNEIVTVTGNRVLGYGVDDQFNLVETLVPIQIPVGEETVAQATETATFSGTLTPTAEVGVASIIESEVLGDALEEFPAVPGFDLGNFNVTTPPIVTATTGAINVGTGALAAGTYEYRVAFFQNTGVSTTYEGAPSATFGSVTIGANTDIDLTGLPTDASWSGRNLYRSLNGGAFQLVDTLDAITADYTHDNPAVGATLNDDSLETEANYSYYVTFYDVGSGEESRPTAQIGALAISDPNRRIRIDGIPQPTSGNFDAVRIYRNTADSDEFHLVATLTDGQTTFIDNVPDADITGNPTIDLVGPKANSATLLTDVVIRNGETYSTPFQLGVLTFTGEKGGRTLAAKELNITATTNVADLLEFMNQSLGIDETLDVAAADAPGHDINDGVITFTANAGTANTLDIGLSAFSLLPTGSTSSTQVAMDFTETQAADGDGSITDFIVFDSLGIPVTVRVTTVLEASDGDSTTYRWYATSADNEPVATDGVDTVLGNGTLTFNGQGRIIGDPVATIAVQRENTASDLLEFDLDFTQVSGLAVANNQGQSVSTLAMTRQDGFPPGTLSSFIVTESGLIRGVFSNGTEPPLGQVRMARFANNAGLQQVGDNVFTEGVNSGEAIQSNPGENGIGTLTAGAVELSNTDIGQNLIELILASTQYRGGTRVITAAQQLLDELMSLRA